MARRNDNLLLYGIFAAIGYTLFQMVRGQKVTSPASAPATHASGASGGAVPGSPNQVLTPDQQAVQTFLNMGGSSSAVI